MLKLQNQNDFLLTCTTQANPAAGADFSYTVPLPHRLKLIFVELLFAADANAANRLTQIVAHNGTRITYRSGAAGVITANETIACDWTSGVGNFDNSANLRLIAPIGDDFIVDYGSTIKSVTDNIQAGDQISDIILTFISVSSIIQNL